MRDEIVTTGSIETRYRGPKSSGNGGYSAGLFAQVIDGPAEVTLIAPPPLETPIALRPVSCGFEAVHGETLIARVQPAEVSIDPPPFPDDAAVAAAREGFLSECGGEHLLPHCFVCGTWRSEGDGLRLFTGPAPDSPVNADFWAPGDDLADSDGLVRSEFMWAALDCPSAFALRLWPRLSLLGRLAAEIYRRPKAGERLIVAAWPDRSEGRKHFASTVILDADRNIIAAANALWIEINDETMLAQLKADRS